ncbi:MAG: DUF1059 domain-containing protein [Thermoplasmataceae archaeon]
MASYSFRCKDIGMNCDFQASAKTTEELLPKIAEHAKSAHNIQQIDDSLKNKVNAAIKKKLF